MIRERPGSAEPARRRGEDIADGDPVHAVVMGTAVSATAMYGGAVDGRIVHIARGMVGAPAFPALDPERRKDRHHRRVERRGQVHGACAGADKERGAIDETGELYEPEPAGGVDKALVGERHKRPKVGKVR